MELGCKGQYGDQSMAQDRNKRLIQQTIKALRQGMPQWADDQERDARSGADSGLQEGGFRAVKVLPVDLGQLSAAYAVRGTLDLLDGKSAGWKSVDMSASFCYWEVKLHAKAFFWSAAKGRPQDVFPFTATHTCRTAHLLAYSIIFGLNDWEAELQDNLVKMTAELEKRVPEVWAEAVYEPFVLMLHHKTFGSDLPRHVTDRKLGPYENILSRWDQPEKLGEAIASACDYHCQRMSDSTLGHEFHVQPFDLYPVEILAIYKVRERLGLETPIVDHPLMSTPLASLAARDLKPIDDPIIRRVEKLDSDFFGGT
jgi:hypothetical protein